MSADNGVYVLVNKAKDGSREFRVAYASAVDNISYKRETFGKAWQVWAFGPSKVYTVESDAILSAHKLAKQFPILEYGVSSIDEYANEEFPDMTHEQAKQICGYTY